MRRMLFIENLRAVLASLTKKDGVSTAPWWWRGGNVVRPLSAPGGPCALSPVVPVIPIGKGRSTLGIMEKGSHNLNNFLLLP